MTAQTCPHCFAPVRGGGLPTCLCAAAGAEDFDPLRIRPYVSLAGQDGDEDRDAVDGQDGWDERDHLDERDDLLGGSGGIPDARTGMRTAAPQAPPAVPRPLRSGPTSRTFTSSSETPPGTPAAPGGHAAPRKRALPAVLAVTGAAVAATAVLLGTDMLSGGERDRAAPPDHSTVAPTAAFPTHGSPGPSATGPSSPHPSQAPSQRPSSRPTSRDTLTPHRTPTPRPPAPTRASGSVSRPPDGQPSTAPTGPIALREGSSGPEVAELQNRLRQLARYLGPDDGRYDADVRAAVARYQEAYGVTGDPDGVYGEQTRASLESQTDEP
ncbi:peptidoglycan-binding protein [Streptomyces sp. NPDC048483]|uniref:peptidoglycan-binding domain-containing protein n=1 Tax=Streptomyces sp. NPDC048483 TaxID=3154927 RepID=UPI00341D423A